MPKTTIQVLLCVTIVATSILQRRSREVRILFPLPLPLTGLNTHLIGYTGVD